MKKSHPSRSPIRKQLVKKIVSYYDTLERTRSRSTHKNKKGGQNRKSILSPKRRPKGFQASAGLEFYEDNFNRKKKLNQLKHLMKAELKKAQRDGSLDFKEDSLRKSVNGYPSFMKESSGKKVLKSSQKKIRDMVAKKSLVNVLEKKVEQAEAQQESDFEAFDSLMLEDQTFRENEPKKTRGPSYAKKRNFGNFGRSGKGVDERLYPVDKTNVYRIGSSADAEQYDFHERKSKEIRRLQYMAEWADKSSRRSAERSRSRGTGQQESSARRKSSRKRSGGQNRQYEKYEKNGNLGRNYEENGIFGSMPVVGGGGRALGRRSNQQRRSSRRRMVESPLKDLAEEISTKKLKDDEKIEKIMEMERLLGEELQKISQKSPKPIARSPQKSGSYIESKVVVTSPCVRRTRQDRLERPDRARMGENQNPKHMDLVDNRAQMHRSPAAVGSNYNSITDPRQKSSLYFSPKLILWPVKPDANELVNTAERSIRNTERQRREQEMLQEPQTNHENPPEVSNPSRNLYNSSSSIKKQNGEKTHQSQQNQGYETVMRSQEKSSVISSHPDQNSAEKRCDPDESYPIRVIFEEQTFGAMMQCFDGFKISEDDELLEVREGDYVSVTLTDFDEIDPYWQERVEGKFRGVVMRPEDSDGDCDLVIEDSSGGRYRIYITDKEDQEEGSEDDEEESEEVIEEEEEHHRDGENEEGEGREIEEIEDIEEEDSSAVSQAEEELEEAENGDYDGEMVEEGGTEADDGEEEYEEVVEEVYEEVIEETTTTTTTTKYFAKDPVSGANRVLQVTEKEVTTSSHKKVNNTLNGNNTSFSETRPVIETFTHHETTEEILPASEDQFVALAHPEPAQTPVINRYNKIEEEDAYSTLKLPIKSHLQPSEEQFQSLKVQIDDSNCEVINPDKRFLGKGRFSFRHNQKDVEYRRGIMIDKDNKTSLILFNRENEDELILKRTGDYKTLEIIEREELAAFRSPINHLRVITLTLKQVLGPVSITSRNCPRQIFYIDRPADHLINDVLYCGEVAKVNCTDNKDYNGVVSVLKDSKGEACELRLNLFPEVRDAVLGDRFSNGSYDVKSNIDFVSILFYEPLKGYEDIDGCLGLVEELAAERAAQLEITQRDRHLLSSERFLYPKNGSEENRPVKLNLAQPGVLDGRNELTHVPGAKYNLNHPPIHPKNHKNSQNVQNSQNPKNSNFFNENAVESEEEKKMIIPITSKSIRVIQEGEGSFERDDRLGGIDNIEETTTVYLEERVREMNELSRGGCPSMAQDDLDQQIQARLDALEGVGAVESEIESEGLEGLSGGRFGVVMYETPQIDRKEVDTDAECVQNLYVNRPRYKKLKRGFEAENGGSGAGVDSHAAVGVEGAKKSLGLMGVGRKRGSHDVVSRKTEVLEERAEEASGVAEPPRIDHMLRMGSSEMYSPIKNETFKNFENQEKFEKNKKIEKNEKMKKIENLVKNENNLEKFFNENRQNSQEKITSEDPGSQNYNVLGNTLGLDSIELDITNIRGHKFTVSVKKKFESQTDTDSEIAESPSSDPISEKDQESSESPTSSQAVVNAQNRLNLERNKRKTKKGISANNHNQDTIIATNPDAFKKKQEDEPPIPQVLEKSPKNQISPKKPKKKKRRSKMERRRKKLREQQQTVIEIKQQPLPSPGTIPEEPSDENEKEEETSNSGALEVPQLLESQLDSLCGVPGQETVPQIAPILAESEVDSAAVLGDLGRSELVNSRYIGKRVEESEVCVAKISALEMNGLNFAKKSVFEKRAKNGKNQIPDPRSTIDEHEKTIPQNRVFMMDSFEQVESEKSQKIEESQKSQRSSSQAIQDLPGLTNEHRSSIHPNNPNSNQIIYPEGLKIDQTLQNAQNQQLLSEEDRIALNESIRLVEGSAVYSHNFTTNTNTNTVTNTTTNYYTESRSQNLAGKDSLATGYDSSAVGLETPSKYRTNDLILKFSQNGGTSSSGPKNGISGVDLGVEESFKQTETSPSFKPAENEVSEGGERNCENGVEIRPRVSNRYSKASSVRFSPAEEPKMVKMGKTSSQILRVKNRVSEGLKALERRELSRQRLNEIQIDQNQRENGQKARNLKNLKISQKDQKFAQKPQKGPRRCYYHKNELRNQRDEQIPPKRAKKEDFRRRRNRSKTALFDEFNESLEKIMNTSSSKKLNNALNRPRIPISSYQAGHQNRALRSSSKKKDSHRSSSRHQLYPAGHQTNPTTTQYPKNNQIQQIHLSPKNQSSGAQNASRRPPRHNQPAQYPPRDQNSQKSAQISQNSNTQKSLIAEHFGSIQLNVDIDEQKKLDFTGYGEVRVLRSTETSPNHPTNLAPFDEPVHRTLDDGRSKGFYEAYKEPGARLRSTLGHNHKLVTPTKSELDSKARTFYTNNRGIECGTNDCSPFERAGRAGLVTYYRNPITTGEMNLMPTPEKERVTDVIRALRQLEDNVSGVFYQFSRFLKHFLAFIFCQFLGVFWQVSRQRCVC